jgi:hypothetical protein
MTLLSTYARWLAQRGQPRRTPDRRVRLRPTLEALETRNLLSTLTVTSVRDTGVAGDGSLRGEIAAAAPGDQIVFGANLSGFQTITLARAKGPLVLGQSLTIQGSGENQLTISGNNSTQVFQIAPGANVTINDLTIARGNADGFAVSAGGIVNQGTLTLNRVGLSDNHANNNPNATSLAGAILNEGTLNITQFDFSNNHADGDGVGAGAIFNGAGAALTVDGGLTGGTFTGNTANGGGQTGFGAGAIFNAGGNVTVNNSLLQGNLANGDGFASGGILNDSNGMTTVTNTTVDGNHADGTAIDGGGGILNIAQAVTLDHVNVTNNHADNGGTATAGGINNLGSLTLENSKVSGNSGATAGILNAGALTLDQASSVNAPDGIKNVGKGTENVVQPVTASLMRARRKHHGKRRLMVVERFADTGAVKAMFVSPFQQPRFKHIAVSVARDHGDGIPQALVVTAVRKGKTYTAILPA